ncbi:GNAT family N-acetyltransferase [Luteimonas sp. R10]|uniref:GNAT family N-acetyltransferase n=1 Tax=Luteimonas sp. R10 TaxID=3108176 RepID=UPI00308AD2B4|nr:GNAT family N-acetyltransferase [Luteimonas sp. R10]
MEHQASKRHASTSFPRRPRRRVRHLHGRGRHPLPRVRSNVPRRLHEGDGRTCRGGSFFVVEDEGRVQGFYRITRQEGRAGHVVGLGTFAIAPEARGTGLARSILEAAIARLHSEGVTRVELTVEADNPRAIGFYGKLGFVHEGTLRSAYKRSGDAHYTDELLMARLLPPLAGRSDG